MHFYTSQDIAITSVKCRYYLHDIALIFMYKYSGVTLQLIINEISTLMRK